MIGRGIYAEEADSILVKCEAKLVLVCIFGGNRGTQCEAVGDPEEMVKLSEILKTLADKIEEQYRMLPHAE